MEQLSINQFICISNKILYVNLDTVSHRYNKKNSMHGDVIRVGDLLFIRKDVLHLHFNDADMKRIERDINASIFESFLDAEERRKLETHNLQMISTQQQDIDEYKTAFIKKNFEIGELKRLVKKNDAYEKEIQILKEDLATHANYLDYHLDSLGKRDNYIKVLQETLKLQETFISGLYTLKIANHTNSM